MISNILLGRINPDEEIQKIVINHDNKPQKSISYLKIISKYFSNIARASNFYKLLTEVVESPLHFKNVMHLNSSTISNLKKVSAGLDSIGEGLIIIKLPLSLVNLEETIEEALEKGKKVCVRTIDKLCEACLDIIGDIGFLALLGETLSMFSLGFSGLVKIVSLISFIASGLFGFKMNVEDFLKYKFLHKYQTQKSSNGENTQQEIVELNAAEQSQISQNPEKGKVSDLQRNKTILDEKQKLYLIKLAKDIVSIILLTLVVTQLILGISILPAPIMSLMIVTCIILSIWAYVYNKSMTYGAKLPHRGEIENANFVDSYN